MFTALETSIKAFADRFDGEALHVAEEARDAALAELDTVKERVARTEPFIAGFEAALRIAVAAADPAVKADVESLLTTFITDMGGALAAKM